MRQLFTILAFLGPVLQILAAAVSVFVNNFGDFRSKYGIAERLYLQPASPAFIIWNLIFLSFLALGIYQLRPSLRHDERFVKARPFIFLSGLGNCIWFYGDIQVMLSICTVGFLIMLISLSRLNVIFDLGECSANPRDWWLVKFPISIFYGWITIAFPIGITLWLMTDFGLTGYEIGTPVIWSVAIVVVALGIFSMLFWRGWVSPVFQLTGIWGLFWIYRANVNPEPILAYASLTAALILLIELILVQSGLKAKMSLKATVQ